MGRFKAGHGRTGKNGKKKKVDEAAAVSEPCIEEKIAKSHKKKPKPYEKWKRESQERIVAWLSSKEGQWRPKDQDTCDCELGLKTRHEAHDLFCPVFYCFAFEIGCCAWNTEEWLHGQRCKRVSLRGTYGYPMNPCDCMWNPIARSKRRFPREDFTHCSVCYRVKLGPFSQCERVERWRWGSRRGHVVGNGNIVDFSPLSLEFDVWV